MSVQQFQGGLNPLYPSSSSTKRGENMKATLNCGFVPMHLHTSCRISYEAAFTHCKFHELDFQLEARLKPGKNHLAHVYGLIFKYHFCELVVELEWLRILIDDNFKWFFLV